jgi:hypothetical protein
MTKQVVKKGSRIKCTVVRSNFRREEFMKTYLALALCTTFLASCVATPHQLAAQFERNFERRIQTYGASCEKIGFERNTDPWRHCVMTAAPYGHVHH